MVRELRRESTVAPSPASPIRRPIGSQRAWAIAAATILALILIYWLRIVLLPFVFAAAIAFVTTPVVNLLSRRAHLRRWIAALIVYVLVLALITAAGFWAVSVLFPEAKELSIHAPEMIGSTFHALVRKDHLHVLGSDITPDAIVASASDALRNWIGGPAAAIAGIFAVLIAGFLSLLLLLFFLLSGPKLVTGALWLIPPNQRTAATALVMEIRPVLVRYILGVLLIVTLTSLLSWIALALILHLPHAVIVSLAVGILEMIPVVGPAASAALLGILGIVSEKVGVVIGVAIFALALRLLIDQVVGPLVLGRAVKLHPVVVIFAMLAGGTLFGILGVLLAVPVAASVKIALRRAYDDRSDSAASSSTGSAGETQGE